MAPDAVHEMDDLGPPPAPETALAVLAAPVRDWFRQCLGAPTAGQRLAWPALAAGKHLLLSAPTGSGKTLAAFLPIVSRLLSEAPPAGGVRCLYLSPLKALAADSRKNLRRCLAGIRTCTPASRTLTIGVRTGDTAARLRRRLLRQPPDFLLTTPESLAVLLSQSAGAALFHELRWVIVDEIHALATNKRGADLSLSLERLSAVAGQEIQRIGLSATCAPVAEVARYLVGTGRPCAIGRVADTTPLQLTIEPLEPPQDTSHLGPSRIRGFVASLVDRLGPELRANHTTLIFANARSLAERLTWALRRRFPQWAEQIAAHHSSLAAARRRVVERRLKLGKLRAVVSSTSLELGIDIGSVDLVVLIHPPGGVVRLLQRVGRAGHTPGQVRRGLVLTATAAELLEAAVTCASSQPAQCEPLCVPPAPLDVLCQQLLGMAAQQPWSAAEALALVRRAYPYRDLSPRDLQDCLDYLSGRHDDGRSWLPARLAWHDDRFTLRDERTARLLRRNIGTIIADEPRTVRMQNDERGMMNDRSGSSFIVPHSSFSVVGEIDEPFADQLKPGDRFLLDGRCLEFLRTDGPALLVEEGNGYPAAPRWQGSSWPLSAELARRLYLLRTQAAEALRDGPAALAWLLRHDYGLDPPACRMLVEYFQAQECISEIPDGAACLVEAVNGPFSSEYYVHTPLNRKGNDALARVAALRLARSLGRTVTSMVADLGFMLSAAGDDLTPEDLRSLLAVADFDADLAQALSESVTLRERFRRVALTGLMLLRNPLGRRRRVGGHDWAERRLFEQVRRQDPDFVLLRQALREVCEECVDAEAAGTFLRELPRLVIRWRWLSQVSPFAASWTQPAAGPVEGVEGPAEALRRLQAALLDQ
jgi:ATP-dependent Lhr-like helicase